MDQQGRFSATTHPLEGNGGGIFPELLKDVGSGLQRMIRSEVDQVKSEAFAVARQLRPSIAAIVLGGSLTVLALGFLFLTVMFALETAVPDWLAALIVGVLVLISGLVVVSSGRRSLRKKMQTATRDVQWAKQ